MSKLELILLGQFECLLPSGTRISLSMRKAEVLLAYLALTPGLRHPRERLINLLWSDRSEEQARNSLRQCLSAIRKSLGDVADMVLQVDRTTVSLVAELIDIDVHEFERLAAEGDYESLTTAADLYQGEFLEGISIRDASCQEWLDSERGRFKRQFIEILSELSETQLLSHDFKNAIKSAERLVKQDPLGESGWRLLMRSYHESGDRNHALQAFKRCQQALREELNVEPESATIELRDRITSGDKRSEAYPAATAAPSAPAEIAAVDSHSSIDHSIAVLPFDNLSGDPEQEYFSDGITDSIIVNLSAFPDLQVKSRNSSFAFKQQIKSIGEISDELGVDYLVEGSIRKSGQRIRITVQLIEAQSGNQIWGKRYDAELADLFDLEEDLSRTIAATVTGQIESDLQRIALAKGAADQQAYDLLLSGSYHFRKITRPDIAIAINELNRCLELDPNNVLAHSLLYYCHAMNWMERWVEDIEPSFELARKHARKAYELGPENGAALIAYAEHLIFSDEHEKAMIYIDKALAINPNDPDALAMKSLDLTTMGRYEEALQAAELGCRLDPYHHWCDWCLAEAQYFCNQYEKALETIAVSKNAPGFIRIYTIAANINLGRMDVAKQALQDFLQSARNEMMVMPGNRDEWLRYTIDNAPYKNVRINHQLIDYLYEAGLEEELGARQCVGDERSIAVLPFDNLSGDPAQEYFSDGITESIILNLSLFPGLVVKSRNSSFAFKQQIKSPGEISQELDVDYIVEGSIRKTDDRIRVTVQLVEAASGNQVWGKRYEAEIDNLFDLEEELSRSIAATVTGQIESELQRVAISRKAVDQQAYDLLLSGNFHLDQGDRDNVMLAIDEFKQCLSRDPDNARGHANLFYCYDMLVMDHWSEDIPRARELSAEHIRKAVALEPDSSMVQVAYASYLIFIHEIDEAERQLKRAMKTNPNDTEAIAMLAVSLSCQGKSEAALDQAETALRLDPYHPWARWIKSESLFFCGRYEDCLATIADTDNAPGFIRIYTVAANVKLGHMNNAGTALGDFLTYCREQMSSLPQSRDDWRKYYRDNAPFTDPERNELVIDCLLEAGLGDALEQSTDSVPSIAVLPFENMSGDPEQEHFADGITTDIIATLAKFRHMRVVARYSILQYKDQKTSISDIAEQQHVRYILEGSVRKSGWHIRVSSQLIDAHNDQVCWSERFDRDLDDLFAVQDEITQSIALAMKVQMDDGEMALYRSKGATSIKAWELALTAADLLDTYIRQNILDARAMAKEAIRLDPDYAYAWITLGWTYFEEAYSGWSDSIEELIEQAVKANHHAMNLDPNYGEAWSQAGMNHQMKHEADEAIAACLRAVELEPGSAEVHALTAFAYLANGNHEEARKYEQNVLNLCPIRPNWYYLVSGAIEKKCGNLDLAIEHFQQGIDVEPDSPLCRFYMIDALMEKGDEARAQQLANEIQLLDKSVTGKGLVHSHSYDASECQRFHDNLAKFDLV